jgi:hypothetical protein
MSPYSRKGALSSTLSPAGRFYDHTSILKFIEWRFGLPALTTRDAAAANIGELLDFGQTPRLDAAQIVDLLPRVPITSQPCDGDLLDGLPGAGDIPTSSPVGASDFDLALASGYFEKAGYTLNPAPLKVALGG